MSNGQAERCATGRRCRPIFKRNRPEELRRLRRDHRDGRCLVDSALRSRSTSPAPPARSPHASTPLPHRHHPHPTDQRSRPDRPLGQASHPAPATELAVGTRAGRAAPPHPPRSPLSNSLTTAEGPETNQWKAGQTGQPPTPSTHLNNHKDQLHTWHYSSGGSRLSSPQRHRTRSRHPHRDQRMERRSQPLVWTKTADEILDNLASYCQRINDSRH